MTENCSPHFHFLAFLTFFVSPHEVRGQQLEIQGRLSGGGREVINWIEGCVFKSRLEDELTNERRGNTPARKTKESSRSGASQTKRELID